jgi:hypothetical protein
MSKEERAGLRARIDAAIEEARKLKAKAFPNEVQK